MHFVLLACWFGQLSTLQEYEYVYHRCVRQCVDESRRMSYIMMADYRNTAGGRAYRREPAWFFCLGRSPRCARQPMQRSKRRWLYAIQGRSPWAMSSVGIHRSREFPTRGTFTSHVSIDHPVFWWGLGGFELVVVSWDSGRSLKRETRVPQGSCQKTLFTVTLRSRKSRGGKHRKRRHGSTEALPTPLTLALTLALGQPRTPLGGAISTERG